MDTGRRAGTFRRVEDMESVGQSGRFRIIRMNPVLTAVLQMDSARRHQHNTAQSRRPYRATGRGHGCTY